jgi:heme exporter protein A
LLQAEQLYCERDDRVLFSDLSFQLEAGELLQVEGANGSGKTTLLHILTGLFQDFEGCLYWREASLPGNWHSYASDMGFIGHQAGVKAGLSATENLRWLAAIQGRTLTMPIEQALAAVGLRGYEDVPSSALSAGQKRRIALARLYLEQPTLWILDEPFTAIDQRGVKALEAQFARHCAAGGMIMVTTHQPLQYASVRKLILDGSKSA